MGRSQEEARHHAIFPQVRTGDLGACSSPWQPGPPRRPPPRDPDEAELQKHFTAVDVWHYPVAYDVGYNGQDVVVTRELVALPPPAGKLCFIRFDLLRGEGEFPMASSLPAWRAPQ